MYSWCVTVPVQPRDPFVFPSPGKLRCVRYDLLYAGFTVQDTDDYWSLHALHLSEYPMTVFCLRYADRYGLQVTEIVVKNTIGS